MAKKKEKRPTLEDINRTPRFLIAYDPSQDGSGYAVLDLHYKEPRIADMGVIKGRTKTWATDTPRQVKLALIQAKVKELRAKYDPIFPIVFFERGFTRFNNSTQATFRSRGALEAELVGLTIVEFPPTEVKKVATGDGSASKEEVAQAMADLFGISVDDFETEDVSDALAIAYTGYVEYFIKQGE